MFENLFKQPGALSRHRDGPLAAERAAYLAHREKTGAALETLVRLARELLVVVQELDPTTQSLRNAGPTTAT